MSPEHIPHNPEDQPFHRVEIELTPFAREFDDPIEAVYEPAELVRQINVEIGRYGLKIVLFEQGYPLEHQLTIESGATQIYGDDEYIEQDIERATEAGTIIPDATARVIASQIHDGQASAMYSLASCGAIDAEGLDHEIGRMERDDDINDDVKRWCKHLRAYIASRVENGQTGRVEGWSKLWVGGQS